MRWLRRKPAAPVRGYTKAGKVAHRLDSDGNTLCPNLRGWPTTVWLGSGSDEERKHLASLPPCPACEHAAGQVTS